MIEILFGATVVIAFILIAWANNTLKEEYRYKHRLEEDTIDKARLDKGNGEKKKHSVGGRT